MAMDLIYATGRGLKQGSSFGQNTFKLFVDNPDVEKSVCLHLDVEIEGPGKSQIVTQNFGNGTVGVNYRVAKAGNYLIHVKYQGNHIEGSPFHLKVN
ncbi:filamin-A [Folsomia candida]|uniref:filamin-A n=1 Tax=Folsomia candida TaxID=158441 RepID=UPI000B8FE018|nr:filamin-A [Folsomia candida]